MNSASARPARQRFLGLDLAWSARNPSGTAAIDESGAVLERAGTIVSDADLVAWVRGHAADAGGPDDAVVLGIDMPTIVRNATGCRPCESAVRAEFGRAHAGPHPSNRGRFGGEGRARALLDELGIEERLDVPPRAAGRFAFEVFPHPALVRLFERTQIFRYKKKPGRSWETVLAEWSAYRAALATLESADPPLFLPPDLPASATRAGYKAAEDALDAIASAYVARFVWRWGLPSPHVSLFGDLRDGYIVVPRHAVRDGSS